MTRPLSNLIPALVVAGSLLASTALVTLVPRTSWAAIAAPVALVAGLIGADLLHGMRAGRRLPSAGALILAASILGASAIVASDDLDRLAAMMPIFGSSAVLPLFLGGRGKESLR
ncbi:MAG: hypothetical protein ABI609_10775 [Acidobacteriota bacterium]